MPSFDQVWVLLSEVICILHERERAVVLEKHDEHPRNRLDKLFQA